MPALCFPMYPQDFYCVIFAPFLKNIKTFMIYSAPSHNNGFLGGYQCYPRFCINKIFIIILEIQIDLALNANY